jgi:hypothetical protein
MRWANLGDWVIMPGSFALEILWPSDKSESIADWGRQKSRNRLRDNGLRLWRITVSNR